MTAKFVAEQGELKGLTLPLHEGEEWVIGRDPDLCQILVEDPSASRRHLVCRASPEGITVENLSDTNPILINKEAVDKPMLLQDGDAVKIGDGIYRFYSGEETTMNHATQENEEQEIIDEDAPEQDTIYEENSDEDKGILAEIDFDLRETGRWLLKVIGGPNNGAEFSMQTGSEYTVGTDPTACDVVFHDTSVSRRHAKISISNNDTITIEDFNSRNGTLVDGQPMEGSLPIEPNTLVSMGTTSFILFDREGDMQTIISPLLPSIVKVLQQEDEENKEIEEKKEKQREKAEAKEKTEKTQGALGAFILIGIITGLFVVVGVGTMTLFQNAPIQVKEKIDFTAALQQAMQQFPSVKYSYNDNTGRLLLIGHVMTLSDKNQLMYNLQGLEFLKNVDDSGLIIDEYVWRETNQVLGRDRRFKGISVHSPAAGKYVLSGYLQTRKQAEELADYITANFLYLDNLERRVIVEEDVLTTVETDLQNASLRNLKVEIDNGELTISGSAGREELAKIDRLVRKFREIPGVRNVKTYISEVEAEQNMMNLTSKYNVSGFSHQGGVNLNVVIGGRILTRGDTLNGMTITSIRPNVIFLEKSGVKYRIDYNQQ